MATARYAWAQAGVAELASCSQSWARSRSKSRRVSPVVSAKERALSASVANGATGRSATAVSGKCWTVVITTPWWDGSGCSTARFVEHPLSRSFTARTVLAVTVSVVSKLRAWIRLRGRGSPTGRFVTGAVCPTVVIALRPPASRPHNRGQSEGVMTGGADSPQEQPAVRRRWCTFHQMVSRIRARTPPSGACSRRWSSGRS